MAYLKLKKDRKKIDACVCGKNKRKTLYRTPELSPDELDLKIGTLEIAVVEIVLPIILAVNRVSILIPFVVIPLPVLILVLLIVRVAKGHSAICSLRWAYFAVSGASRFMSF